jgi:hypothetical protein
MNHILYHSSPKKIYKFKKLLNFFFESSVQAMAVSLIYKHRYGKCFIYKVEIPDSIYKKLYHVSTEIMTNEMLNSDDPDGDEDLAFMLVANDNGRLTDKNRNLMPSTNYPDGMKRLQKILKKKPGIICEEEGNYLSDASELIDSDFFEFLEENDDRLMESFPVMLYCLRTH